MLAGGIIHRWRRAVTASYFPELPHRRVFSFPPLAGRGSKQSRFRWRYAMYSVAQVALGQALALEVLPWDEDDAAQADDSHDFSSGADPIYIRPVGPAAGAAPAPAVPVSRSWLIKHTYPLRPELLVPLSLPQDLTAQEAERLAAFIRALAVMPLN